jgi:3-oxoacyl-[acyl-carrier protein] reductase
MKIQLTAKNALVGASTGGIGYGVATVLAECGANVTLMARNEAKLKQAVDLLPVVHKNQSHSYLVVDFLDYEKYHQRISEFVKQNPIDILVNNTNGPKPGTALTMDMASYQQAFDLLFKTVCETTSLVLPHMIAKKQGRIINVSSITIKEPSANLVLSNTIRSATAAWAKTLSKEVAVYNITVNNVLTGYFDTERINQLITEEAALGKLTTEEIRQKREAHVPMKRLGKPEEYGHLVAFLASEYAGYLTGANIPLDGGLTN